MLCFARFGNIRYLGCIKKSFTKYIYDCLLLSMQHTARFKFSVKLPLCTSTSSLQFDLISSHSLRFVRAACKFFSPVCPVSHGSSSDHVSVPGYFTIRSISSSLGFTVRISVGPSNFLGLSVNLFSMLTRTSATHL